MLEGCDTQVRVTILIDEKINNFFREIRIQFLSKPFMHGYFCVNHNKIPAQFHKQYINYFVFNICIRILEKSFDISIMQT